MPECIWNPCAAPMSEPLDRPALLTPTAWFPAGDGGTIKDLENVPIISALTPFTKTVLSYVMSMLDSLEPNPVPLTLTVTPGGPLVVLSVKEEPSTSMSVWMLALEVTKPPADTV